MDKMKEIQTADNATGLKVFKRRAGLVAYFRKSYGLFY